MKIAAFEADESTIVLVDDDTDETAHEIDRMNDLERGDMEPLEAAKDWCAKNGHQLIEWNGQSLKEEGEGDE